jgi:hypothetical protein
VTRRHLVLAAVGLAFVLGSYLALGAFTERAWELRKRRLAELALVRPEGRRPWEVRFEALVERARTSPRFREITDSPYRPYPALGSDEPRALDEFERLWVESLWNELAGLDAVVAVLRKSPPEDLEWNGATARLGIQREITNALCGRAWLALEARDHAAAAGAYADALRLARATDDGSVMGTHVRLASEGIVLRSIRGALAFRGSPRALRKELVPVLEPLAFDPERAERAIRIDLAEIPAAEASGAPWDDPAYMLAYYASVEDGLALVREPPQVVRARFEADRGDSDLARGWETGIHSLHWLHAQRNVALTTLAVAAHREKHGRFPATLAEIADLPAEHALDPLVGTPLPYALDDGTARIGPTAWSPPSDEPGRAPDVWTLR